MISVKSNDFSMDEGWVSRRSAQIVRKLLWEASHSEGVAGCSPLRTRRAQRAFLGTAVYRVSRWLTLGISIARWGGAGAAPPQKRMACFWIVAKVDIDVVFCLLWTRHCTEDEYMTCGFCFIHLCLSFIFEVVQRKKKKEKWVNLMRTGVLLRPKHPEFRNVKVWYLSCHSESSYVLTVQDE